LEKVQERCLTLTLEGKESPDIGWSGYAKGVGIFAPEGEKSQGQLQGNVNNMTVDGKEFKAWRKGERDKFSPLAIQIPASKLPSIVTSGKILIAIVIKNKVSQGPHHMVLSSCNKIPTKHSRTLLFGVSDEVYQQIYNLGGVLRLVPSTLTIFCKGGHWYILGGQINLQKGDFSASSLMEYLRAFPQTRSNEQSRERRRQDPTKTGLHL